MRRRGASSRRRGGPRRGTLRSSSSAATPDAERGKLMPLGDALGEYLKSSGLLQRKRAVPAIDAWNEAVGEDLASKAQAVSFRRGELVIEVHNTALLSELRGFAAEDLRTRADALLEGARIRKLTFKLKPRS